ncbi:DUF6527 family protein [Ramlibacter tataouinensis]|uniref:DUF6527 family protein n=1 Tax=Ramlibacter tataouinensis TaxID=94132 RepID=UPI0022F3D025|nr:DUF6527 family protein [Ramlibacter tataouinensis]WBY00041.1 DUF6527 family protein [Ramlibacter tataouinensis]
MKRRARTLDFRGMVEHRHEADDHLDAPGQAVVVHRGVDRSLTMVCPDGCGEVLTINLDRRSGPAWRVYLEEQALSLYPSVWRNTGCRSHFIVWRSRIYWCDWGDELLSVGVVFEARVLQALSDTLRPYSDVAQELNEVPWAALSACRRLQIRGVVVEGGGDRQGWFRRERT